MIPWLTADAPFPDVTTALSEPNGLLCGGGDLSPQRLLTGYRRGIFPWFADGDPILWWSPDPRTILVPGTFHCSHSLRRRLRRGDYEVRLDSAFNQVMHACAQRPRRGQQGTWITDRMQRAYQCLHELGIAHSVETWVDGCLVGGLYGVEFGRAFFGESMYADTSDASKIALAHLDRLLRERGFIVIDCQMHTSHLESLGARQVSREAFCRLLDAATGSLEAVPWRSDGARYDWHD